ncbi:gustatory and pheromone receptor 32a-like [Schistocerca americana]|uniref:gustatory and pheromone receptor 32a-like n=1 Tax=Schistocerca americana TaxID=7009 RepID=UPI001F4FA7DA|nr:gustatory and pheromone receptor 32a-like [Schistocerca americana]
MYAMLKLYQELPKITVFVDVAVRLLNSSRVLWPFACSTIFMLEDLKLFLESLEYFDGRVQYKKQKRGKLVGLLLCCVSFVLRAVEFSLATVYLRRFPENTRVVLWILYALFGGLESLVLLQITTLVLELRERFRVLNDSILIAATPHGDRHFSRILLGYVRQAALVSHLGVDRLHHAHAVLQRAAEFFQRHFGISLVLHITTSFSALIYGAYEFLVLWVAPEKSHATVVNNSKASAATWLTSHLLNLVAVVLSCSATVDEAERTRDLVVRVATLQGRPFLSAGMEPLLTQVLTSRPLSFKAAGFLTIDRHLLVSALCVTITYLVILAQISLN